MSSASPVHGPFDREFHNLGYAEGLEQGLLKGVRETGARLVLRLLDVRGIEVSDEVRARISACADPAQFETWVVRALGDQDLFREVR